jgi:hypothetical protein
MKKQHLWRFSFLVAVFFMTANYAWAQKDTTFWMTMLEYRVHDQSVFEKNYPTVRSWWLKADEGIEYDRAAHTSESGRIYGLVFFKGSDNFGAFMAKRVKLNDAFAKKEPAISKENTKNVNGPFTRSIWMRVDSLCNYEAGYKMENYDFRKIQFISVTADKIKEFEADVRKQNELDAAHGIKYNIIVFRCTDGYPSNTYMLALPDKSLLDYYNNREARRKIRDKAKNDYDAANKLAAEISSVVRIDHLNRVKIQ